MGGDGGVKATSRRFMRGAKENNPATDEGKNAKELQIRRSRICAQSGAALEEPIVCCEMGILYNKDVMLTALLEKSINPSFIHVSGLKDLKTLKLCPNPSFRLESGGEMNSRYMCPITKVEFNGQHPFVVIWSTGFVLSEKAVREVGIDNLQEEYGPFAAIDVVRMLPSEGEEIHTQSAAMAERRLLRKQHAKKTKKLSSSNSSSSGAVVGGGAGNRDEGEVAAEARSTEAMSMLGGHAKRRKVDGKRPSSSSSSSSFSSSSSSSSSSSATAAAIARVTSLSSTKATVAAAKNAIASQLQKSSAAASGGKSSGSGSSKSTNSSRGGGSDVYSKLFHKDGDKLANKRDLMMSTSGLRYTLG